MHLHCRLLSTIPIFSRVTKEECNILGYVIPPEVAKPSNYNSVITEWH